jgi:hypothetical protein
MCQIKLDLTCPEKLQTNYRLSMGPRGFSVHVAGREKLLEHTAPTESQLTLVTFQSTEFLLCESSSLHTYILFAYTATSPRSEYNEADLKA